MTEDRAAFRRLLIGSLTALAACAVLVTLCYFFIDRQVAFYVHEHQLNRSETLKQITYVPIYLENAALVLIALTMVHLAFGTPGRFERMLLAMSISLVVGLAFEYALKIVFGRYWPDTWIDHNPSLIQDDAYGFHFFHRGSWYESFPSGHTVRIVAVMAVLWTAYPRWRWLSILASAAVIVGLVGMNYHFVGDTAAGACLGGIVGAYTAACSGLNRPTAAASTPM